MKRSMTTLALLATASLLPLTAASASEPMYKVLAPHGNVHPGVHYNAPQSLATWNGTIKYNGSTYNFTMVGTDPSSTNTTTTITTYVIPIKMVYTAAIYGKKYVFNPNTTQWNGASVTSQLVNSPLFGTMDWTFGSTDTGTTQYIDAWQRGSFWGNVSTNTSYHVVLAPTVLSLQVIKPTKAQGGAIATEFGVQVGEMNINSFDQQLQKFITKFSQINPTNLPLFVTDNIYLTSGGCCIGGYHSADNNGQSYSYATFVTHAGAFSQDISAFSHELGEWLDDPLITSNSPCGLLEVGDPLEGKANYGDFTVTYNNISWHPQAMVWMEYFGDPANFSANNWLDNQHIETSVCQNGH